MTKNFNISEFQCKCGCKMTANVKENIIKLANQLQVIRDYINKPISINSAYRCLSHNKSVGGVPNSQHVYGKAADIKISGVIPFEVVKTINTLISNGKMTEGGLGTYNTFTHYDIRGYKSRWDYRK